MAYIDRARRPSPTSMAAVAGVHAAIAVLLLTGLSMSGAIAPPEPDFAGFDLKDPPKPPPPPPPQPVDEPDVALPKTVPFVPKPRIDVATEPSDLETTRVFPPTGPIIPNPGPRTLPDPLPSVAIETFDPVPARPRNDPARWLSDADYKSSWARRELEGTARFRLQIAATGKVTGCTVTGSTGHSELDRATCALIEKRAKFEPARGKQGEPIASSFSSAVVWRLPE